MTDICVLDAKRRRGRPRKKVVIEIPEGELTDADRLRVQYEELLTTAEAAALTKMSVAWFKQKRWERKGPPFRKRGRSVRYLKSELFAWFREFRETDFRGSS